MMRRCIAFRLQPLAGSCAASQSSSAGSVGFSPSLPRSFEVGQIPAPKWCCHSRFATVRSASALRGSVIQRASASRRPLDSPCGRDAGGSGSNRAAIAGTPGSTRSPGACGLPRSMTRVSRGSGASRTASTSMPSPGSSQSPAPSSGSAHRTTLSVSIELNGLDL